MHFVRNDQELAPNFSKYTTDEPSLCEVNARLKESDGLYILCSDPAKAYAHFAAQLTEVEAAGGVVAFGDKILAMRRNGRWDLPKGHQDPGEDISVTALREVMEETGIDNLQLKDLICITDHCYKRNGIWHLKHTWWYDMLYTDPTDLTPQREEDIAKAAWVAKSSLPPYLLNTYPSILEVFREAKV